MEGKLRSDNGCQIATARADSACAEASSTLQIRNTTSNISAHTGAGLVSCARRHVLTTDAIATVVIIEYMNPRASCRTIIPRLSASRSLQMEKASTERTAMMRAHAKTARRNNVVGTRDASETEAGRSAIARSIRIFRTETIAMTSATSKHTAKSTVGRKSAENGMDWSMDSALIALDRRAGTTE